MPSYLVEMEDGKKYQVEADSPPTEQDLQQYLGAGSDAQVSAPAEKERPFFGVKDTLSALGDVWEGVKQTPSAIRAGMAGFKNPRLYTPEEVAANADRTKFSQGIAQRQSEREASGESSSVGNAIRGAAQSAPFTLSNAAAMGAAELASRAIGAGVGALAGPEAIPVGSQVGSSVGKLLRFGASGVAGYAAANASAGQMFLNDTLGEIKTRFKQQTGKEMSEAEQDEAYKEVLPLAEEYGKAEAGPETVGNLAQLWGGRYLLGLGKHAVEGIAKRIGAGVLGQVTEHGGETYTGSAQHNLEERKNALIESRAVNPENIRTGLPGYVESFKEQAPTTLALSVLGLGAGAAYKGIKSAVTPATPQQPETSAGGLPTGEPIPVQVNGQTIAHIPPGSDLTPEDVAMYAAEPGGPDTLKAMARKGYITLPEMVAPVEGVDPAITQEMSDNVAAGAALAPATVEALKASQAAAVGVVVPLNRRQQIQSRLAEIENQYGPREDVTIGADGHPTQVKPRRINTTEEDALLKEIDGLNAAENVATPPQVSPVTTAEPYTEQNIPADKLESLQFLLGLHNKEHSDDVKREAEKHFAALLNDDPKYYRFVRSGNSKVFLDTRTGEYVKLTSTPGDAASQSVLDQVGLLKKYGTRFAEVPDITTIFKGDGTLDIHRQKPVGVEGASIFKDLTPSDKALFLELQKQNPLSSDEDLNPALRVETDSSLKNMGLVLGADGQVRAMAFDFDGIPESATPKDRAQAVHTLESWENMPGVPLVDFSPRVQQRIRDSNVSSLSTGTANPAITNPAAQKSKPTQTASGKKIGDKIDRGEDVKVLSEDDQSTPGMPEELTVLEVDGILDAGSNTVFARRRDMTPAEIAAKQEKIRQRNIVAAEMGFPQEEVPQPVQAKYGVAENAPRITDLTRQAAARPAGTEKGSNLNLPQQQTPQNNAPRTEKIENGVREEPAPGDQSRKVESTEPRDSVLRAEEERREEVAPFAKPPKIPRLLPEQTARLRKIALDRFAADPASLQRLRDKVGENLTPDQAADLAVEWVQQARDNSEMALIDDALADQPDWSYQEAWKALKGNVENWTPQFNTPAATTINGHPVVGTVGAPLPGGKMSFHYDWNGKPQTAVVPTARLSRPVTVLSEAPRYIYNQEQNTRKAGKHIPVTPGVHKNFNFQQAFASMAEDKSLSRIYQEIARLLSKMPIFANMDLHIVADGRRPYAGEYSHSNGRSAIAINLRQVARGKVDALGTLLHEALHHVTLAKIRNPQGDVELDAVHALNTIRLKLAQLPGAAQFDYELGSNEEFITGVFTHPGFQDFLASLPANFAPKAMLGKFRSLLSEIFRRIAELVTGKYVAPGSTLEQSMASILTLFETPHRMLETGPLEKLSVKSLAENGVTPEQDAEYMQAVRDGDVAKQQAAPSQGSESAPVNYSMEMIPGANTGHPLAHLIDAPYSVKEQYHKDVTKAFLEPGTGVDLLADAFKLTGGINNGITAESVYINTQGQVEFNPATQVPLQASEPSNAGNFNKSSPIDYVSNPGDTVSKIVATLGGKGEAAKVVEAQLRKLTPSLPSDSKAKIPTGTKLRLPSTIFDRVKAYAIAHGILQHQEAVAGFTPVTDESVPLEKRNGIAINLGRSLGSTELQRLLDIVRQRFGTVNSMGYFPTSMGFSLVNFGISGNTEFRELVHDIKTDVLFGGMLRNSSYFATHEDHSIYIERGSGSGSGSEKANYPPDHGYVDALASTGYGPAFQRVRLRIEPRLAEVNRLWKARTAIAQQYLSLGIKEAWDVALKATGGKTNPNRQPLKDAIKVDIKPGMTPQEIRVNAYKAVDAGEKREGREPASERMVQTSARAALALSQMPRSDLSMVDISVSGNAPVKFKGITEFQSHLETLLGDVVGKASTSDVSQNDKEAIVSALNDMVVGRLVKDGSGADWYNTAVQVAMAITHNIHPELRSDFDSERLYKALVAVTSQGQRVDHNWYFADLVYRYWKDNKKLPDIISFGGKSNGQITGNLIKLQKLIDKHGLKKSMDILDTPMTAKEVDKMVWDMMPDLEGKSAVGGEQKEAMLYGAMMLGPKIGSFYGNLNYRFDTVTMDLWFMRTIQRLLGRPFGITLGGPASGGTFSGKKVTMGGLRGQLQRLQFDLESKRDNAAKAVGIADLKKAVKDAEKFFDKATAKARKAKNKQEKSDAQREQRTARDILYSARIKLAQSTFGPTEKKVLKEIEKFLKLSDTQVSDRRNEVITRLASVSDYSSAVHGEYQRHGYRPQFATEHTRAAKNVDESLTSGKEAPGSGGERNAIREIMDALQLRLLSQGLDLANADVQAVLWYAEKDLYAAFGVADDAEGQDYGYSAAVLASKIANGEDIKRGGSVGDSSNPDDVIRVKNAEKENDEDGVANTQAMAAPAITRDAEGNSTLYSLPEEDGTVTPAQDAEYMQAVRDGDVAKQQAMVDEAAKAAGYKVGPMFHRTWADFTEFKFGDESRVWYKGDRLRTMTGKSGKAFFFAADKERTHAFHNQTPKGGEGKILSVFLKIKNPLVVDEDTKEWAQEVFADDNKEFPSLVTDQARKSVMAEGYDGIENYFNGVNSKQTPDEVLVFDPNQIKSADPVTRDAEGNVIPLSQRFNPESNSTLYSLPEEDGTVPPTIDIGGEAEAADGKGTQLHQKKQGAIHQTYTTPADITLQEKRTQEETLAKARSIIGESVAVDGPIKGRRAALDRFRLDTSIPPEVRAAGTGLIAQQTDILANLEEGNQQLLLDEMTDEAAKLSGVIASDPDSFKNLKADANLNIDKMAEEAGRTLNIFNVFRRLTPEGFLRRMTRKYNDAVREKVGQNFDVPVEKVESEIALLRRLARESTSLERRKAILAAIKAYQQHDIDAKKLIEALFPQAGFRERMNKGGEALVRNFFQMIAGPRDGKGPLAEFDESIQGALSDMLRKVMEAQGLVAKNASNQMTDIDKMVRSVSGDELRFDKIAAADAEMQKELAKIPDPERRATLQQAWEEATSKMYTNIASGASVRRAINAELKDLKVDWTKLFDTNQSPAATRSKVVDAVMKKIEGLLTDPKDPTVQRNLGMLRDEVGAAFDFIASNKHTAWLAQREAVEARRRVAEHRAAFMEALRNQGVAEQAINRIGEKMAGPQRGKPDQNPVSALVGEHLKKEVPDFVDKLVALDVDRATAEQLDKAAAALRTEIAAAEKIKDAERAVQQLMKSLKPKPRAPREKIEKSLKALFTADTVGALDDQAFFDAFGEAFGLPPLSAEQQTRIKKLVREINALPKGPARLDKQQELDEELGLWKGIAARDVLLSAWYANILSGVSTQGMGVLGNLLNFVPRSLFNAISNPRSAGAYLKGAFGEGLSTGLKEAKAAMQGRGLYKVSKYGDKNIVSALELLRKKGPSTLPEWVAYIASAGTRMRYVFRIMQAIDALAWNTAREGHAYLAAHRALLEQEKESGEKRSPEEFYKAFIDSLGGDTAQIEEDLRAARQTLIDAGQTPALLTVDRMAREARNARRAASGTKAGNRFADRIVLQQEPEGSGKFISKLVDAFQKELNILGIPVGQLLIPFNKIVSNLFEQSLDYTPVGLVRAVLGGHLSDVKAGSLWNGQVDFKEGTVQFDQMERRERAMAAVAGMAAAAIMYALAHAHKDDPDEDVPFMVYGWGPESKTKRTQMPKGWVPYSVKVGDHYIKFSEMPFGMMFAAAGSAMDAMRYKNMDKKTSAQRLAYILKTSVKGFLNQGVMSSLDTAMESVMFQASDKKMSDIPVNAVKGLLPAQGLLRDINTIFDPNKVSSDTLTSALLRDIPFAKSYGTKPDLNVFGEPIKMDGYPILRRIITHREPHAVADYLGRNDLHIPGMEQTIEIGKYLPKKAHDRIKLRAIELGAMENGLFTPEQNYTFKRRAGELTKAAVQELVTSVPKIANDVQRKHVQSIIDKKVENARRRAMLDAIPVK